MYNIEKEMHIHSFTFIEQNTLKTYLILKVQLGLSNHFDTSEPKKCLNDNRNLDFLTQSFCQSGKAYILIAWNFECQLRQLKISKNYFVTKITE